MVAETADGSKPDGEKGLACRRVRLLPELDIDFSVGHAPGGLHIALA